MLYPLSYEGGGYTLRAGGPPPARSERPLAP